jgi:transcriptional regulator NrdR family protein
MKCPECHAKNVTRDTRQYRDDQMGFNWVERKTVCPDCNTLTKTIEMPMSVWDKARVALFRSYTNDSEREDS